MTDLLPAGITATAGNGVTSQGSYNATTGLWAIGTLASGDSATLLLEGTVDTGQSGTTIVNATTAATGDQNDPTTVGDDLTESVSIDNDADLVTVKTLASGDSTPDEGDTVTFQIEVTNNGAAQATNVSLTDLLPVGITAVAGNGVTSQGSYNATTGLWNIGTLNSGSSATLTLEGRVDVGQGGTTITNATTAATGDQNDPTTAGDDLTETVTVNNDADLVTVKTLASGDPTPDEGNTVTFQIEVTNNGAAQATNVSLTDLLPAGITATAGNGVTSQGSYNATTGLWTIGTLASGDSATLLLEGTVDTGQSGTTIVNATTAATGDQNDPTTVGDDLTESVSIDNDADLVTVKTLASGDSTPDEGDTVTFQIEVTNNGAAQATNVSLTDLLPVGVTAVAGNGVTSQGSYNATTGLWNIGTLNSGSSATLTLEGRVDVGQGGTTITNATTAATGDQNDPTTAGDDLTETVTVNNDANLVTVKTLASGDPTPDEGDTVTFQIEVTNNGAAQATNVSLMDLLPSGITPTVGNGVTSQGSYNATTGVWAIGTLSTSSSATLTLVGTVDVGRGGTTITNATTAATGDQNDPTTVGDNLTESVSIDNDADLVTVKTLASGDSTPDEGDMVTFQIEVTNNGAAQATNVSLTDLLPAGITATAGNGVTSQGSYNATTGLWTIGTLDSGSVATLTLEGTVDVGQGGTTITNATTAATGDQNDPTTAGDDLTEAVTVNNDADLVTVKTLASGDPTPDEGNMVTFQIEVTNNGAAQATNVSLTDLLPAGITATAGNGVTSQGSYNATTGLWTIGTLDSGSVATFTLEGRVDVGQGGTTITNATTAATGDQNDPTTAGDDLTEAFTVNNDADLVTVKTLASGDPTPDEGDTVTFQIEVTNNGAAQATNVSLTDLLPVSLTATAGNGVTSQGSYNATAGLWAIGTLASGDSATLILEGTVDSGQSGTTITNATTAATGDQNDPTTVGDDLTESVSIDNDADLVTVKTLASGDSTPDEGDMVTFQIEVTNNGAAQATNVSLTDLLPAGITAAAGNGVTSQGSYNATTGVWTIGTLSSGSSATLTLEGTVDVGQGGTTITNATTAAMGDQNDPTTVGDDLTEAVTVNNDADLVTVKTLASGDPAPDEGDTVTFQIEVTNNGAAQATNISLTDLLPAGLTATAGNGVTSQGSYNATTGLWAIGTLASGDSATLNLEGTVDTGQSGTTIVNATTAATGDQNDPTTAGDDLTESVSIDNDADLVTVKTLASGDSTPDEGDTVTFQIEVTNNGAAQATNVSLTDLLPVGITAVAGNGVTSQGSYNATTGLWNIGTLNSGSSATLTLEGTVDVGQGGTTITNATTAAMGDQNDPTTVGDDLTEAVTVNSDADLVTVKTLASGDPTPDEGDTVTFQIEVTNNGAAQATNVSLTDLLPVGITAAAGSGVTSQGSYNSTTGVWTIGTLDSGSVATLTLEGRVDVGQGGTTITNATTAATGDQNDPTTAGDDLTEAVTVNNDADLVTVKTLASGDPAPDEGDTVAFQIEVTNNGAAQATNVSLTDLLPRGITAAVGNGVTSQGSYNATTGLWAIGTLGSGDSATLILEGTVDSGQSGTTITNATTAATGDQNDPTTVGDDLTESVSIDNDADLVTVKTLASGDPTPDEGDTVTFQIEVTNNGAAQATNVSLTDLLPSGITATAGNGVVSQGTYNATTGLWTIGTLEIGSSATLILEGTVDVGQGGTTLTNATTAATGDQNDPTTAGDDLIESVSVSDLSNLVTRKTLTSGDSSPQEGDTVTFEILVTNDGAAQATNVLLTDSLPSGLTPTAGNGFVSQGSYDPSTGIWTLGTLANGASATLVLEGIVNPGQGGNTITNISTAATGDQTDPTTVGDDLDESVTIVNEANLVTVKSLASGNPFPSEGDTVTFLIEVTNNGLARATNVSLVDVLPSALNIAPRNGLLSQGTYNSTTGLWLIGDLDMGQTASLILEGVVPVGLGGTTILNQTTPATADQNDPTTAGDDLEELVTVANDADLVTVKTLASGDATPDEGDTVQFLITVSNNGGAQASNVVLTDLLPNGITAIASNGGVSQGTYDVSSGVWAVGTLNSGSAATLTLVGTVDAGTGGTSITNTTTAAIGDQPDPTSLGDELTQTININAFADLVTVKTLASGDSTPDEGDTVAFEIVVTNNGAARATGVSLTDVLPAGITPTANNGLVSQGSYNDLNGVWLLGTLERGASANLMLEGTIDVGFGGTAITNVTTSAMGDQADPTTVGDDLEETINIRNDANLVTVKSLLSGNGTPNEGETVTFQIQVTHAGGAQATNVTLTDLLPAALSATASNGTTSQGVYSAVTGLWDLGTLNVGDVATLILEGTVDVGQGGNTITNTTTPAVADQNDPTTVGDDYEESVNAPNDANLVTVKTLRSGNSTPAEGDVVSFEIQVSNNGPSQATNVSLTDFLPAGLTPTIGNGIATQGVYTESNGTWVIGTLENGDTATLTLEGTVDIGQGGMPIDNVATAAVGDQDDPTTVGDDLEESVVVGNDADLATVKTLASGDATPDEGDTVRFEIQVTNNGPTRATNVSLIDLLPNGLTPTANNGDANRGTYDSFTGVWTVGDLLDGESATLVLEGTVNAGQGGATITNVTTAANGDQDDSDTTSDDLTESIVVNNEADLQTVKVLTSGNPNPVEGEVVTFRIQVTNNGTARATNVVLTDFLPTGLTATSNNGTVSQGNYSEVSGLWTVGQLDFGSIATLTLEGSVDVGQAGNTIVNVATAATGDQDDPNPLGDDLEESVSVENNADLVTTKTLVSGNANPLEGEIVRFQIVVANNGPARATNVTLNDLLPAGISPTANNGGVSQGTYNSSTGLWAIGVLDSGATATLSLEGSVDAGTAGSTITNTTSAASGDQDDPTTAGDDYEESISPASGSILVQKSIASVDPASSGVAHNYDITYELIVTNNGPVDLANFSLTDDWLAQLGPNFVGVIPGSVIVTNISALMLPAANSGYSGNALENMLDGSGLLQPGEQFSVRLSVEVDPDAAPSFHVDDHLVSRATVQAEVSGGLGMVSDLSDDPNVPTDIDPERDGEPDDFTRVGLRDVTLTKVLTGPPTPATSGVGDNLDVPFRFTVTNTGAMTLSNLSLVDNLASQLGGAFVRVVPGTLSVTNIDAQVAPVVNTAYDGNSVNDLLAGSSVDQLGSAESFRVDLIIEVDPDSPTAVRSNGQLQNQATITGLNIFGEQSTDASDNPTDPTDLDLDMDNDPDDPTSISFARIALDKEVLAVAPAGSGVDGNVDATFRFRVSNTGNVDLTNLSITDDWGSQLGTNFVRVIPGSVVVANVTSTTLPGDNPNYSGGATENMLDGTGVLQVGEQFDVSVVVELDPDADPSFLLNGGFENQAIVQAIDGVGNPVADLSDDPSDPADVDLNADSDPDDPTSISIPEITITKTASQITPASSGAINNFDVTYEFLVTNTGSARLTNLILVDDWAAQFGSNFVRVVPGGLQVTDVNSTTVPFANPNYTGGSQNVLAGGGLIEAGQSFRVSVIVEVDPDADPSQLTNGALLNLASIQGEDLDRPGVFVSDLSDDSDSAGVGGPDDPTPLRIPNIEVLKRIVGTPVSSASGVAGNFDVTYEFVITNTGTTALESLSLQEDLRSQLGGAFVRIASGPRITQSSAADIPEISLGYDGGLTDAEIFSRSSGASSLLNPNDMVTVLVDVEVDPDNATAVVNPGTGELENQVTVQAFDLTTTTPVTDDSDDPGDPSTAPNDPTNLMVPQIQLTMTIVDIDQLPNGNALVDYELVVSNNGNDTLTDLLLTDDWGGQFGGAFVGIGPAGVSITNVDADVLPAANATYVGNAGENMLDGTGTISRGQSFIVHVQVEVDPDSPTALFVDGALQSTALISGQGTNSSVVVSDASDDPFNVTNADPDLDNDPDDPTSLRFSSVSVAKAVSNVVPNGDFWNTTFDIVIGNNSANPITQISVIDDLASQLGPAYVGLASAPIITASTATMTPNLDPTYDGTTNTDIFDGASGTMLPGEQVSLQFVAIVNPAAAGATSLVNQVEAIALDPNGNPVSDLSDAGQNPNTTNPSVPGDTGTPNDPTPIQIGDIGLAKQVTDLRYSGSNEVELRLRMVIQNTGTVDLDNISLVDDVAAEYGASFGSILGVPRIVQSTGGAIAPNLNPGWSADTSQDLFDGTSGFLPPGGRITLEFEVSLVPETGVSQVFNQALVAASDSNGTRVTDLSDDGANPIGNNGLGGSDDPTPARLLFFAFDAFNNFAFPLSRHSVAISTYQPRPIIDTAYSGQATPGATLRLEILDQTGQSIGWRSVVADAGGNWLAQFPNANTHSRDVHYGQSHFGASFDGSQPSFRSGARGGQVFRSFHPAGSPSSRTFTASTLGHHLFHHPGTEIDGQPHRMEIRQSSTGFQGSVIGAKRFFHPAVHGQLYFQEMTTIDAALVNSPSRSLLDLHQVNTHPLQLGGGERVRGGLGGVGVSQIQVSSSNVSSQ